MQQKKRLQEGGLYSAKREARVPGVQAAASGGGLWRSVIFLVINAFCCDSSACGAFFLICNLRVVNLIALCKNTLREEGKCAKEKTL